MRSVLSLTLLLAILFTLAAADAPFTFKDELSDAASFSYIWKPTSFGWKVASGALTYTLPPREFAVLRNAPLGREVSVSAAMTLREATGAEWKTAGVSIFIDKKNFWHLALVESPDTQGKKHFVELVEMLEGNWLAQGAKESRLTPVPGTGSAFVWEYGKPYRMTLEMTTNGITGIITAEDGTVVWKSGYAFTAKAVTYGKPSLDSGGFATEYRSLSAAVKNTVTITEVARTYPGYTSLTPQKLTGKATGFFRVENIGGRWWVFDPNGSAFFGIGTDHINYRSHFCEALGYAPYHSNAVKKYGTEEKWADASVSRLKEWNFNLAGAGSGKSVFYKGLTHAIETGLGGAFCRFGDDYVLTYPTNKKPTPGSFFPNVFHPEFRAFCELSVEERYAKDKNDPWLFGYFLDNELAWYGKDQRITYGLTEETLKKPASHPAKTALIDWLKNRYPSVEQLNAAWGATAPSYEAIRAGTNGFTGKNTVTVEHDKTDFVRLIADKYFEIISSSIRKFDKNHMILGCRFAGGASPAYEPVWEAAGKYCDIVTFNYYGSVDLDTGVTFTHISGGTMTLPDLFTKFHGLAKRPLMITEWAFPAYDSGLPCKHGAGMRVNTQTERSYCYEVYQKMIFGLPFMVGSDYFMWGDEPALGISANFPEDSNYGLVNEQDEPWELLVKTATRVNAMAYQIHAGNTTELSVTAGANGTFTVENRGNISAKADITLVTDGVASVKSFTIDAKKSISIPPDTAAKKPGGHVLACIADKNGTLVEADRSDNIASAVIYTPGAVIGARKRIPFVIANTSSKPMPDGVRVIRISNIAAAVDWKSVKDNIRVIDAGNNDTAFQIDLFPEGGEIAVTTKKLAAYTCETFFIVVGEMPKQVKPGIAFEQTGNAYTIDNGVLKMTKAETGGGSIFDRIEMNGTEAGKFLPLIWQSSPQNFWVGPDRIESVTAYQGAVRLTLDITAVLSGAGDVTTEVDKDGKFAKAQTSPKKFRIRSRISVYPGKNYFTAAWLSVENIDTTAWKMNSYFFHATANIGGDGKDDEAKKNRWYDATNDLSYGAVSPVKEIAVNFWKDKGGGQHPDIFRSVGLDLAPGVKYAEPQIPVYVGCVKGDLEPWAAFEQTLKSSSTMSILTFSLETK
ncbi:MAG: hypothetical protein HZC28_05095 [Spirochaetes bacterium]|nr:hypothetical protein [Spirochaetota bacterium]